MMVIFLNNDVLKSPQTPFKIWIKRVAGSSIIKLGKNAFKIIFVTYNGLITKLYEHFKTKLLIQNLFGFYYLIFHEFSWASIFPHIFVHFFVA